MLKWKTVCALKKKLNNKSIHTKKNYYFPLTATK